MLDQVWRLPRGESDFVTVVVPEYFETASMWAQARHPSELALKFRLLTEPGVVIADVPTIAGRPTVPAEANRGARPRLRRQCGVDARGELRDDARHRRHARGQLRVQRRMRARIRHEWASQGPRVTLEIDEAPYRDIGGPLLRYLRDLTAEEGTEVLVLMPELVTHGWRRLLHNQRSLYIKRLLLLEPE